MFPSKSQNSLLSVCLLLCASIALAAPQQVGTVAIGSSATAAVTLTIPSATTLASVSVLTSGVANLEFTDAGNDTCISGSSFDANATCMVNVSFAPQFSGPR